MASHARKRKLIDEDNQDNVMTKQKQPRHLSSATRSPTRSNPVLPARPPPLRHFTSSHQQLGATPISQHPSNDGAIHPTPPQRRSSSSSTSEVSSATPASTENLHTCTANVTSPKISSSASVPNALGETSITPDSSTPSSPFHTPPTSPSRVEKSDNVTVTAPQEHVSTTPQPFASTSEKPTSTTPQQPASTTPQRSAPTTVQEPPTTPPQQLSTKSHESGDKDPCTSTSLDFAAGRLSAFARPAPPSPKSSSAHDTAETDDEDPHKCDWCKVIYTSESHRLQHISGKRHRKNKGFRSAKMDFKEDLNSVEDCTEDDWPRQFDLNCPVCEGRPTFDSAVEYTKHFTSQQHRNKVFSSKQQSASAESEEGNQNLSKQPAKGKSGVKMERDPTILREVIFHPKNFPVNLNQ